MYQNLHGRFTAVDPLLASGKSANPQTFNRYAYTMNRPLILVDPTGLQAGTSCSGNSPCGNIPKPPKLDVWVVERDKSGKETQRGLSKAETKIVNELVNSNWPIIYNTALNVATRDNQPKTEVVETTRSKESSTTGGIDVSKQPGVNLGGSDAVKASETERPVPSLQDSLDANKNYLNNNAVAIDKFKEQGTISNGAEFVGIINGQLRSSATELVNQASQSPRLPDEQYVKDKANEQMNCISQDLI